MDAKSLQAQSKLKSETNVAHENNLSSPQVTHENFRPLPPGDGTMTEDNRKVDDTDKPVYTPAVALSEIAVSEGAGVKPPPSVTLDKCMGHLEQAPSLMSSMKDDISISGSTVLSSAQYSEVSSEVAD